MSSVDNVGSWLSVLILVRNERSHIVRCLRSIETLRVPVFVVDSHSTDGTADMATSLGAQVFQCSESRFADKLNWAISNIPFSSEWVMRLDADEIPSGEMIDSLRDVLSSVPMEVSGLLVRRQIWFMGQWIRYGGIYPSWTMRFWRTGKATCEARDLDEHMLLVQGVARYVPLDVIDDPLTDLSSWIEKHNRYASIEAKASLRDAGDGLMRPRLLGSVPERIRWVKVHIFYRIPPFIRPLFYFIYRYVFRLGFLDGKKGFVFHFLHALWYRVLVDAKLLEQSSKRSAESP